MEEAETTFQKVISLKKMKVVVQACQTLPVVYKVVLYGTSL